MTFDKAQLKALAEAAGNDEWYADGDLRYCDDKTGETHGMHHDDSRLIAAASPASILALFAEIERLDMENGSLRGSTKRMGEDASRAQRQARKQQREIDQLKAELAGLRTGYDAQNNVIAGLKAENEELEKAAMSYGEDLQWHTYELERVRAERDELRKDAENWQTVQSAMEQLKSDEQGAAIWSACSRILISLASDLNSARSVVTEEGVTKDGAEIGDWRVTVERLAMAKEASHG